MRGSSGDFARFESGLTRTLPKLQLVGRYLLALCALGAACYALLLAGAEWLFEQNTARSLHAAVQLAPYEARYLGRLAAWRTAEKPALLKRAIELNPFDSEALIELGLWSEFQAHDASAAEKLLLQAATVNHMFLPKWSLTNFYFRQGRPDNFFHWAYATLAITPYSPEPVFVQMWLLSQNADTIAAAVPNRPRVLLPYAWFLTNARQYGALPAVVERLVAAVGQRDPRFWGRDDLVAAIEDRLLAEGDSHTALQIWSTLARAGWISAGIPTERSPITNGNFHAPFYGHGFDWVAGEGAGLRVDKPTPEGAVRLTLSGDQADGSVLLKQYIPLEPGREYRVQWRAESPEAGSWSGLQWHLRPVREGLGAESISGDLIGLPAPEWSFRAAAAQNVGLLTLEYARTLGTFRSRGTIILRSVSSSTR